MERTVLPAGQSGGRHVRVSSGLAASGCAPLCPAADGAAAFAHLACDPGPSRWAGLWRLGGVCVPPLTRGGLGSQGSLVTLRMRRCSWMVRGRGRCSEPRAGGWPAVGSPRWGRERPSSGSFCAFPALSPTLSAFLGTLGVLQEEETGASPSAGCPRLDLPGLLDALPNVPEGQPGAALAQFRHYRPLHGEDPGVTERLPQTLGEWEPRLTSAWLRRLGLHTTVPVPSLTKSRLCPQLLPLSPRALPCP